MTISPDEFRDALRYFGSGVTLVTSHHGEEAHGMTVSAFVSISASPPLVAIVIDRKAGINELLTRPGAVFAVNVLAEDQEALANRFAFEKDEDRFLVGDWQQAPTGSAVLSDALAWLDCTVTGSQIAGSHTVYVGSVTSSAVPRGDAHPLLYWNRDYRHI
jgi:flavin reductase (DIM6/NTAB) family NADH-FMN oxidoreductase RutF